jgi:hypothetical protein
MFFVVHERAIEITLRGVGTIKAAAERATSDAQAIAELRDRIESQGATVDLVAKEASHAHELVRDLEDRTNEAEHQQEKLADTVEKARSKLSEINNIVLFTHTAVAAQNDDRRAFDQLGRWATDTNFPMRAEAEGAYRTIMDQHSQPFYTTGFKVPWREGFDPNSLGMPELKRQYAGAPDWLKPALIEYIWKREDLDRDSQLAFLAEVVRSDGSLKAVEYAGRYLTRAIGKALNPLATDAILEAWQKHKGSGR